MTTIRGQALVECSSFLAFGIPLILSLFFFIQLGAFHGIAMATAQPYIRESLYSNCRLSVINRIKHKVRADRILSAVPGFKNVEFHSSNEGTRCRFEVRIHYVFPLLPVGPKTRTVTITRQHTRPKTENEIQQATARTVPKRSFRTFNKGISL